MQSSSQIVTINKATFILQAVCPSCHPTNSVRALNENRALKENEVGKAINNNSAYIVDDRFSALQCYVDVREDWN